MLVLKPQALTREAFAPYGDVIEAAPGQTTTMNDGRFERYDDLCRVETDAGGRVAVGIASCVEATVLPHEFDHVERHPHGSQAFVPLGLCCFVVAVAPPGEIVSAADVRAFVTNGRQGVNYHRGTWHMPLIAPEKGQRFLIVDRAGDSPNCEERRLDQPLTLAAI